MADQPPLLRKTHYRDLLKKYIEYVNVCEGTDFIYRKPEYMYGFTLEEAEILIELSKEVNG